MVLSTVLGHCFYPPCSCPAGPITFLDDPGPIYGRRRRRRCCQLQEKLYALSTGQPLSLARRSVFRLTDRLDMTIAVDWYLNHKPNKKSIFCDLFNFRMFEFLTILSSSNLALVNFSLKSFPSNNDSISMCVSCLLDSVRLAFSTSRLSFWTARSSVRMSCPVFFLKTFMK